MLLLPEGASRCDLRPLETFQEYAVKHAHNWYSFVNGTLHRMVKNDALYLVTGCDKSSSWGVASFENHSDDCHVSLKLTAAQCGSGGVSCAWKWERGNSISADSGPIRQHGEEDWSNDQTVFLRGYKVAIRSRPLAALKGAVKISSITDFKSADILAKGSFVPYSRGRWGSSGSGKSSTSSSGSSPGGASDSEDVNVEYSPEASGAYDPSDVISECLLDSAEGATVEYFPEASGVKSLLIQK